MLGKLLCGGSTAAWRLVYRSHALQDAAMFNALYAKQLFAAIVLLISWLIPCWFLLFCAVRLQVVRCGLCHPTD